MDYGRYVYEQEQRRRQSKRKATNVVIKEMKFRPKIDEHDYTTKMKHVVRFLGEGNKVKLTIMFRGREMAHPELGLKILQPGRRRRRRRSRSVESDPRQDGRNMTMVLHPTRKDGRKASSKQDAGNPPAGVSPPPRCPRRRRTRTRSCVMPKMKTHRGAAKRFKVTGTGKITRRKAFRAHLLEKKPTRRTRRLGAPGRGRPAATRSASSACSAADTRRLASHAVRRREFQSMARVKRSVHSKKSRRKVLARAEGYRGSRSRSVRKANEQVMHSGNYAYRDRRARKGEFRRLWIVRINAACRENDISYSRFVAGLKAAEIEVDRKILADLAVRDSAAFGALVTTAREALEAA